MADTVAVMNKGHDRAARRTGGALRPAPHPVRRQLPRAGQHRRRHDQGHRRRPPRGRRARHAGQDPQVPLAGARGRGALRRAAREGHRSRARSRRAPATTSRGVVRDVSFLGRGHQLPRRHAERHDLELLRAEPRRRAARPATRRRGLADLEPRPRVRRARRTSRDGPRRPAARRRDPHERARAGGRRPGWSPRPRRPTKRSWTAYLLLLPGRAVARRLLPPAAGAAGGGQPAEPLPRLPRLLLPRPQLRQLRQRAHRLRPALRPVLPLRRAGHPPRVRRWPTRWPTRWRSRPAGGAT